MGEVTIKSKNEILFRRMFEKSGVKKLKVTIGKHQYRSDFMVLLPVLKLLNWLPKWRNSCVITPPSKRRGRPNRCSWTHKDAGTKIEVVEPLMSRAASVFMKQLLGNLRLSTPVVFECVLQITL